MAFLQVDYKSAALGRKTHLNVFLPVDVDPAADPRGPWPVMVLLHGIFGDSSSWVTSSCVQRYADERKLCVLMPDGENGFYLDHPDYMNNYADWVGRELIEAARVMFPVSSRREDTWIGGLSMGGYGSLVNGLRFSERFSKIGMLSPALGLKNPEDRVGEESPIPAGELKETLGTWKEYRGSYRDYESTLCRMKAEGKEIPEMLLAIGREDFLWQEALRVRKQCGELDVPLRWHEGPGMHDHTFWKQAMDPLFQFLTGKEDA